MPYVEKKRYSIGIVESIESRKVSDNDEYDYLLHQIEKFNEDNKNCFYIGNIELEKSVCTFIKYRKISYNYTLKELDDLSVTFKSGYAMKERYGISRTNNHDLLIMYRANKRVRTLPMVFEKDKKYLNRDYICRCFDYYALDTKFINMILGDDHIKSSSRSSLNDFDKLYHLREMLKYETPFDIDTTCLRKFYNSFISEGKSFNYFNFRLLAMLVKNYEKQNEEEMKKSYESLGEYSQLTIDGFENVEDNEYKLEALKTYFEEGDLEGFFNNQRYLKK